MIYLDTSVLAACYWPAPFSGEAERLARVRARPVISDLCEVELLSALARRIRTRQVTRLDAERIVAEFTAHASAGLYTRLSPDRRHFAQAREWLARFAAPLRAADALHLAVCAVERLRLATADRELARAAEQFGVTPLTVIGSGRVTD